MRLQYFAMQLELLFGSILDQKYKIERQLGQGAMGAVFLATHLGTTRPVALKVIMPQLAGTQEFAQRFKREAEAAGRLIHPNVVNVTDFGVTHSGGQDLAYLVMEYLQGQSLADYLEANPRPSFNFVLDVIEQTALALDASHAAGIVHRDLKPSNIWLEPNHRGGYNVKVLDFGIAKMTDPHKERPSKEVDSIATQVMPAPDADALTLISPVAEDLLATPANLKTIAGMSLGTPAYMAPEQCAGFAVNPLADVYGLAVVAYEMLCGRRPFQADTLGELVQQQVQTVPSSPREYDRAVPDALARVVLSGLEKDPARRPPTAGAFAARLRAASDGELTLIRKSKDAFHTHPRTFIPLQLLLVLAAAALMILLLFGVREAARSKLLPDGALLAVIVCCSASVMLFEFQLFKAACALALKRASEQNQFHSTVLSALKAVFAGSGTLLWTQIVSLTDLRPSSFWANGLWPVLWATERISGRKALVRSQQLCRMLPTASKNLAVRHYGPALIGALVGPFLIAQISLMNGAQFHLVFTEVLSSSIVGSLFLIYPLMFGTFYLNYGPAFSFLYWSALVCRNEGTEITLPASARDDARKTSTKDIRPATVIWIALPAIMLAVILWRVNAPAAVQAFEEASHDGRRATVLKLIDGGVNVNQTISDRETALFDAVRDGDQKLMAALLDRGAQVNVQGHWGTPLLLAAEHGHDGLARVLLDRGAVVDSTDRDGRTPLMIAAMRGNVELVQLLLNHGADAARRDNKGKTAAVYAEEEGYRELKDLLSSKIN